MSLTPADLEQFIRAHAITATLVYPPHETPTVELAARAMECAPEQIIKSLLFIADGVPVLVIACGTAKVDQRKIAAHLGLANKRVKLAPADFVLERAGYAVGGMPPFGHREKFRTLIDPAVVAQKEIYGGGGDERTLLKIATEELRRVTNGEVAEVSDNGGK